MPPDAPDLLVATILAVTTLWAGLALWAWAERPAPPLALLGAVFAAECAGALLLCALWPPRGRGGALAYGAWAAYLALKAGVLGALLLSDEEAPAFCWLLGSAPLLVLGTLLVRAAQCGAAFRPPRGGRAPPAPKL